MMRRLLPLVALAALGCAADSAILPVASHDLIAAWGDSMTQGVDAGQSYPDQLAALLGRPVFNGGVGGETSTQVVARFLADTLHAHDAVVLWMGRNNTWETDTIVSQVAAVVAHMRNAKGHYVVLPIHNGDMPTEYKGAPWYDVIMALNARLAAANPDHFLNVRSWLITQGDPSNPQDVLDMAHDVVPSSLRRDVGHLNPKGNALVARKIAEYATAHGW